MNPCTRSAALYAIGAIAILASASALTHSYAGLHDWASHHSLVGWQAMSWPAEIDVFLAIGELALYVAYLDGWPAGQRIWPWATVLIGLGVSVAGNIGHIQPGPGHPVILADRLTAATSPVAAFAGLAIGLLVLKMTRQQTDHRTANLNTPAHQPGPATWSDRLHAVASVRDAAPAGSSGAPPDTGAEPSSEPVKKTAARIGPRRAGSTTSRHDLLREASLICQIAAANGERISQRALARQLRGHGHRFSNDHLRGIAATIGLTATLNLASYHAARIRTRSRTRSRHRQPFSPAAWTTPQTWPKRRSAGRHATRPPQRRGRSTSFWRGPMTPTLGDFLTIAGQRIAAAGQHRDPLPAAAHAEVIVELDRLLTVIARYACDGLNAASPAVTSPVPTRQELTIIGIRLTLLHATESIQHTAPTDGNHATTGHPAATDLRAAVGRTTDAATHILRHDMQSAEQAAAAGWIYSPARQLPETDDLVHVYRYRHASPRQIAELRAAYHHATTATEAVTATLDSLLADRCTPGEPHTLARALQRNPVTAHPQPRCGGFRLPEQALPAQVLRQM